MVPYTDEAALAYYESDSALLALAGDRFSESGSLGSRLSTLEKLLPLSQRNTSRTSRSVREPHIAGNLYALVCPPLLPRRSKGSYGAVLYRKHGALQKREYIYPLDGAAALMAEIGVLPWRDPHDVYKIRAGYVLARLDDAIWWARLLGSTAHLQAMATLAHVLR